MEPFDRQSMYWPASYSYDYYHYNPPFLPSYPLPNQAGAGPSSPPADKQDENGGHQQLGDDSYIYYVKLINPKRKSDFVVRHWHGIKQVFKSPEALKRKLVESFPSDLPRSKGMDFQIGFFDPPYNTKRWIIDERDLTVMYASFESGSKINLWCETNADQSPVEADKLEPATKKKKSTTRDGIEDEIDIIFKKLKERHPDKGSPAVRLWARLIQNGRWDNYDNPPPIPLITGEQNGCKSKKESQTVTDVIAGVLVKALQPHSASPGTKKSDSAVAKISPMKTATIRRSCLEDLKRLKDLLEDGVLTEDEFMEEKRQILDTLKGLK